MLKTPIGIFWDLDSCHIPSQKSPIGASKKIRNFVLSKFANFGIIHEFTGCSSNVKLSDPLFHRDLRLDGVNICETSAKSTTKLKLKEHFDEFRDVFGCDNTVFVVITTDSNLIATITDALNAKMRVILIYGKACSESLKCCVTEYYSFDAVLEFNGNGGDHAVHHHSELEY